MKKSQLRPLFLAKRKQIDLTTLQARSQAISQTLLQQFNFSTINSVHVFLSIQKQHEINTRFFIDQMQQTYPHLMLIVSKTDWNSGVMRSYRLTPETILVENRWGVPEPLEAKEFPNDNIDMVILPLLCFDKQGFRVGYGKGCYDRFLATCRSDCLKVGLSLFDPIAAISDLDEKDVKMDFCILDSQTFSFS